MAVKNIKLGQVWRQDATGQDHLVTKVYSEVFSQYAVLRPAEVTAPERADREGEGRQVGGWRNFARLQLYPGRRVLSIG